jgi:hypothetical protein
LLIARRIRVVAAGRRWVTIGTVVCGGSYSRRPDSGRTRVVRTTIGRSPRDTGER